MMSKCQYCRAYEDRVISLEAERDLLLDERYLLEKAFEKRNKEIDALKADLDDSQSMLKTHSSESRNRLERLVKCEKDRDRWREIALKAREALVKMTGNPCNQQNCEARTKLAKQGKCTPHRCEVCGGLHDDGTCMTIR